MQSKRVAGTAYHVYTNGKVTGMAGEILTGTTTKDGYIAYKLTIGNEKVQVLGHLLVAKAFLPPPRKNMVVNHKDGNKKNNNKSNLEWATSQQNNQHAYDMGLNSQASNRK